LVAGSDGDRAGGLGVHAEGAGRQAGRVDRAEPGGVEGDRGDLLPPSSTSALSVNPTLVVEGRPA
jgi:hypothetical protein